MNNERNPEEIQDIIDSIQKDIEELDNIEKMRIIKIEHIKNTTLKKALELSKKYAGSHEEMKRYLAQKIYSDIRSLLEGRSPNER